MAKLTYKNNTLNIELGVWESLGSFARRITVKRSEIKKVEVFETLDMSILGIRVGGTGIPKVIALGNYRKKGVKIFSLWRRGQEVVVLEITNHRFQKLILGVSDARELAKQLTAGV